MLLSTRTTCTGRRCAACGPRCILARQSSPSMATGPGAGQGRSPGSRARRPTGRRRCGAQATVLPEAFDQQGAQGRRTEAREAAEKESSCTPSPPPGRRRCFPGAADAQAEQEEAGHEDLGISTGCGPAHQYQTKNPMVFVVSGKIGGGPPSQVPSRTSGERDPLNGPGRSGTLGSPSLPPPIHCRC